MSKQRLEEIKAQYHLLKRNGYDLGAWDEPFSWLIERVQELEGKFSRCESILRTRRNAQIEAEYYNERYREAIEKSFNELKYGDTFNAELMLVEALEGEE